MNAKAIVFTSPNEVSLEEFELRAPGPGEVLVEAGYSCISPGTELRCLRGEEAAAGPFPLIPGYAMVGRVVETGEGVTLAQGTPVYCLGTAYSGPFGSFSSGHVSYGIAPESGALPLPQGLALRDAVPAVLGGIALHGRNLLPEVKGKRVLVVGLGVIGQFAARLYQLAGADVTACDLAPHRVELAVRAGLRALAPNGDEPLIDGGAEVIVDCSGSPAALNWALRQASFPAWNPGGDYAAPVWFVVQGSYGGGVSVDYPTAFMREVRMVFPRSVNYSDISDVMTLIRDGSLHCADLLTEATPEEAPRIYRRLLDGDTGCMTAIFRWAND